MKSLTRLIGTGIVAASCLLYSGCEDEGPYNKPDEPVATQPAKKSSGGERKSRDSFSVSIGGRVNIPTGFETTVDVRPNTAYLISVKCVNDGDPDTIELVVDGKSVGTVQTDANRLGGNGWFVNQVKGPLRAVSIGREMQVGVYVRVTDSYGVGIDGLNFKKE
jgi:hypothetical protein